MSTQSPNEAEAASPSLVASLRASHAAIVARMEAACVRAGRSPKSVNLVWVSKTHPVEILLAACEAGAEIFGENRVQEVLEKFPLPPYPDGKPRQVRLHLIGSLQRNKVRKVLPLCDAIHSIDGVELWQACDRIAGELDLRRDVFLQVNTSREAQKGGFAPEQFLATLAALPPAPNLRLIGLMTLAPMNGDLVAARACFKELRQMLEVARNMHGTRFPLLNQLSMGMSGDFEIAIEEGATHIRVGTALFGHR